MQNKLNDRFPSCLIHCATSRPRPLNREPLYVLSSFQLSELQSALGDEHNNSFQETLNLYHILKPIIVRLFRKNLFPDVHFEAVSLIHSGLQRNASQGFGAVNSCVDWSEGFPNMVLRKMNIYEHRTRVARFNSL